MSEHQDLLLIASTHGITHVIVLSNEISASCLGLLWGCFTNEIRHKFIIDTGIIYFYMIAIVFSRERLVLWAYGYIGNYS